MTERSLTRPERHRDAGFTLTEVLIVVVLMGLIATAIATVFTTIVRTTPPTEARADDARSLLGISIWLPTDVSSTPRSPLAADESGDTAGRWSVSSGPTGCGPGDTGQNLLRLSWTENLGGSTTTYVAAYRIVDGPESARIERTTCVNGGARTTINVTAGLPLSMSSPVSVDWKREVDDGTTYIVGVEFEIMTFEGDTLRVDASSRNPAQSLSGIPDAVTTTTVPAPADPDPDPDPDPADPDPADPDPDPTDPTDPPPETTDPPPPEPVPCVASFASIAPNPVKNRGGNGNGVNSVAELEEPVTVTINKTGDCANLVLRYVRVDNNHGSGDDRTEQVRTFGDSITLTLLATPTERWQRGDRPLTLYLTEPDGPGNPVEIRNLVVQ